MTEQNVPPPDEEGTTAEPIPEGETFDSPTSNDVGEQTLTNADKEAADEGDEEGTEETESA